MDDYRPGFYMRVLDGNDGFTPSVRSSPTNVLREKDFEIKSSKHRHGMYFINVTRKLDGRVRVARCFKSEMKRTIGELLKDLGCSGSIDWRGKNEYET